MRRQASQIRKLYSPRASAHAGSAKKKSLKTTFVQPSCTYNVPASTLRHHIYGIIKNGVVEILVMDATSGPQTALSENAEAQLLKYIARCRRLASTVDKDHVLQKAAELEKIEAEAQGQKPKWPEGMVADKGVQVTDRGCHAVLPRCRPGQAAEPDPRGHHRFF